MDYTKLLDIIAYYLSEYDINAVSKLGYKSRSEAFREISKLFGKNNNYLKRLRDEYDVVTSSKRNGQCNRPPRERIIATTNHLSSFSFDEITQIVVAILENHSSNPIKSVNINLASKLDAHDLTEEEIEHIINFKDDRAGVKIVQGKIQQRVYNTSIIKQLKRLYKGTCQLCGVNPVLDFNANITEVHHIDHFSVSQNNNSNNLIVLCPNHHRLIHKLNPTYNPSSQSFVLSDGRTLKILIDYHLHEE